MKRLEPAVVGISFACWGLTLLQTVGWVGLAGTVHLSLYGLYSTAAALGWLAGNVYVARSRAASPGVRRRLRVIYVFGPPGLVYLLRAMAPASEQVLAPLVPLYAFGVYCVLFLVPVVIRRPAPPAG